MPDGEGPPNKRSETAVSSSSPSWEQLPDDLWHKIFTDLALRHHRSVSLVCKRFLALSNRTVTFFSIKPTTIKPAPLRALFSRFPNTASIRLTCDRDVDASITLLANSGLPLQSLHLSEQTHFPKEAMRLLGDRMSGTLKSLSCSRLKGFNDDDLAVVAGCFSYLQEFENESWTALSSETDRGILEISTKLKSLVSVKILYQMNLTYRSLEYLISNCASLRSLRFGLRGYDNYIDMDRLDRFDLFRSLSLLHLEQPKISPRVLVQLSKFDLKVEELILVGPRFTRDVTGEILCIFFKSCRSLRHLELTTSAFPANTNAIELAASLPSIQVIYLRQTGAIPSATLLYLLRKCPLLEEINIACYFLGITQDWFSNTSAKFPLRKFVLFDCKDLCDETLKLLVSVCPKLEALCLWMCSKITQKGMEAVAASCNNIKYLHAGVAKNAQILHWTEGTTYQNNHSKGDGSGRG